MKARFIYEKFVADSDPIHDMHIGNWEETDIMKNLQDLVDEYGGYIKTRRSKQNNTFVAKYFFPYHNYNIHYNNVKKDNYKVYIITLYKHKGSRIYDYILAYEWPLGTIWNEKGMYDANSCKQQIINWL